jgi:hypothetical protein
MVRRWIIRSVFMLPILLCVGGWGWSVGHLTQIRYNRHGAAVFCSTQWGSFQFAWNPKYGEDYPLVYVDSQADAHFLPPDDRRVFQTDFSLPGFRYTSEDGSAVDVSYWLLIVFFSIPLFVVWRKTQPKINPKMGFPVEVKVKHE